MKEFVISEAKVETAVIVGLITPAQNERKTTEYLNELEFLAETAGAKVIKRFTQKMNGPSSSTYLGSGKIEEIAQFIQQKQDEVDAYWEEQMALGRPYEAAIVTGTSSHNKPIFHSPSEWSSSTMNSQPSRYASLKISSKSRYSTEPASSLTSLP